MLEDLESVKEVFDEIDKTLFGVDEKRYLEPVKKKLRNVVNELRGTLDSKEKLYLSWPGGGICWATVWREGLVSYVESDCEGSWGGTVSLDDYFERLQTLEDARSLYDKLSSSSVVWNTETREYRDINM